jgi:hypothetical protein
MDILANRKVLIIGGIVLVGVIVALLFTIGSGSKKAPGDTNTTDSSERFDANSGQTVSNPKDKAPDIYGVDPNEPVILGLSHLLGYGLTSTQLTSLKYAFTAYNKTLNPKIKEVSIGRSSIELTPHDRYSSSTSDSMTFQVIIDSKTTYNAKLEFFDLTTIHLYLTTTTGATVFDSGEVNSGVVDPSERIEEES